jgi:hypothetical protein
VVTDGDRRARAVPGLAKLVRSRDFRTSLAKAAGDDHVQTIIVALPDDTMGYVFDHLHEAGSIGALALVKDGQVSRLAIFWPATPARVAVAEEDDSLAQIHRDSPVEIFFAYLARVHTAVVHCVTARLVDQGDLQLV